MACLECCTKRNIKPEEEKAEEVKSLKIEAEAEAEFITPWKIYPFECYEGLIKEHGKSKVKVIHMVRHGEGTHNVIGESKGNLAVEKFFRDPSNFDAPLTENGQKQCTVLAQHVKDEVPQLVNNVDDIAVITSPLTRCIETALRSFPWLADIATIPFVAEENVRETVNFITDHRRTITELSKEYPRVDFSNCNDDDDIIWNAYRSRVPDESKAMESTELNAVADRARKGFINLQQRTEHHLIVSSHSAFLRCILNWGQEGGVPYPKEQVLDQRSQSQRINHKLFEYVGDQDFEDHMRSNYENCELRSFCMLVID